MEHVVVDYSVWGYAQQATVGLIGQQRARVHEGDTVIAVGDGVPDRRAIVVPLRDNGCRAVIRFVDALARRRAS